jgi:hypothetical protein
LRGDGRKFDDGIAEQPGTRDLLLHDGTHLYEQLRGRGRLDGLGGHHFLAITEGSELGRPLDDEEQERHDDEPRDYERMRGRGR